MKTMDEIRAVTDTRDYDREFWNAMRFKPNSEIALRDAVESTTGTYFAPTSGAADIRTHFSQKILQIRYFRLTCRIFYNGFAL